MRYLMLIKHAEAYRSEPIPQGLIDAMGQLVEESFKNGTLVDTAGLKPSADGSRVRLAHGTLAVTDGPFAETKEVVGGYAIVNAASKQAAVDIATRFMTLHRTHWPEFEGECEVRPLEDMPEPA